MQTQLPSNIPTHVLQKVSNAIVPVVYTEAITALAKCRAIDEGKYYADKADALAAWAKIWKHDEAAKEAKRLKAYAYRRMGQLAEELRPEQRDSMGRALPNAFTELKKAGLSNGTAVQIRRIAAIEQSKFDALVDSPKPPGINRLASHGIGLRNAPGRGHHISSQAWRAFGSADPRVNSANGYKFRTFIRTHSALELGKGIAVGEVLAATKMVAEIREWLDEFEASLPKGE